MPTTTLPSTDHRHLTCDERQQALALIGIVVKIINGRVPHKVEASLHDIGLFLQLWRGQQSPCVARLSSGA
jgi:hypothetical protein